MTISNYEPRANVIRVSSIVTPDENAIDVNIVFSIINNPTPITLNLLLDRVR